MPIKLDIEVNDVVLTGKFKNKRTVVKTIGTDDLGQPTINGKKLLDMRIEKLLPKEKQSKETREMNESNLEGLLAGLLTEQVDLDLLEDFDEMISVAYRPYERKFIQLIQKTLAGMKKKLNVEIDDIAHAHSFYDRASESLAEDIWSVFKEALIKRNKND